MFDHRMIREPDLADDPRALRPRLQALEHDTVLHHVMLGALEPPEKIEMPPRAAEFAVRDRLQARLLLFLDHARDLAILDRLQLRGADLTLRGARPRFLQR